MNESNSLLITGKPISFFAGEIISIGIYQWGIIGKIRVDVKEYKYKLKDPELKKQMEIGMDLIVRNGFCIKGEQGEAVITEGKFGEVEFDINLNRYYSQEEFVEGGKIITGILREIQSDVNEITILIDSMVELNESVSIFGPNDALNLQELYPGSIIRVKSVNSVNKIQSIDSIEVLHKEHFWYKFLTIRDGNLKEISTFLYLFRKKSNLVNQHYETFKQLLFNFGSEILKSSLVFLKEVLHEKVFANKNYPAQVLISSEQIDQYFEGLFLFIKKKLEKNEMFNELDDFIIFLKYVYPPIEMK
jgi:hypothetical protein